MVNVYSREAYGESLFQAITDISINLGQAQRIVGIGVMWMPPANYDHSVTQEAVVAMEATGRKFVVFFGGTGLSFLLRETQVPACQNVGSVEVGKDTNTSLYSTESIWQACMCDS